MCVLVCVILSEGLNLKLDFNGKIHLVPEVPRRLLETLRNIVNKRCEVLINFLDCFGPFYQGLFF